MDDDQEEWNDNEFFDNDDYFDKNGNSKNYDCCGECDGAVQSDRIQLRAQIVAHLLPYYKTDTDKMLDEAKRLEYFVLNGE